MIKRLNKRGQTIGFNQGLLLILGIVGVVLIVWWLYGVSQTGEQLLRASDIDITLMEQKCNGLVSVSDSKTSYCYEKFETKKDNNYVNCQYAEENFGITIEEEKKPTGVDASCGDAVTKICNKIKLDISDFDEEYYVNGVKCNFVKDTTQTDED